MTLREALANGVPFVHPGHASDEVLTKDADFGLVSHKGNVVSMHGWSPGDTVLTTLKEWAEAFPALEARRKDRAKWRKEQNLPPEKPLPLPKG